MSAEMSAEEKTVEPQNTLKKRLGLFEGFGVELEYMIVDRQTLDVLPVTDRLIEAECGHIESEIDLGTISWSNELALHVVELKTTSPEPSLTSLADQFHQHVNRINNRLMQLDRPGQLMPSAMHPWMDPEREMQLWPHEYSAVYEAYNRIFDCRGHGWANLQSVHLNLPFDGDEEFGRLHAAIRLILPLIPGIAAASPVMDGRATGLLDNRLRVYQGNSARIPSLAGRVIPEPVFTEEQYRQQIFQRMYDDIAAFDPDSVLQDEFLNSRGAIARFGRGSIEIRVIDIQECPAADLAVLQTVVAVLKALCDEQWSSTADQQQVAVAPLFDILSSTITDADQAVISNADYLKLFGCEDSTLTVQQVWRHLVRQTLPQMEPNCAEALEVILAHGPLARRLLARLAESDVNRESLHRTWAQLCDGLQHGTLFLP